MKIRMFFSLVLLSGVLSGCANDQSVSVAGQSAPVEQVKSAQDVKSMMDKDHAVVIHALDHAHYTKGHIPGAVNIDYEKMTEAMLPADKETTLIFYCAGGGCPVGKMAAGKASRWGYKHVNVYEGGIKEWQSAGMTVATGE